MFQTKGQKKKMQKALKNVKLQVKINNRVMVKEAVKATFVLQKLSFAKRQVQMKVAFQVTLKIGATMKRRDAKENTSLILTSKHEKLKEKSKNASK